MPGAVGELKRGDGTVKRTVAIVAGVVTLGVALYVSGRLTADPGAPAEAAPAPTMRVRMVNLQHVIKNFKRTETLRAEHAQLFKQYDDEINRIKGLIEARTKQMQQPEYLDKRDAFEKEIKRLDREMKEKTDDARQALDKKQGELIVLVYKELDEAVRTYARQANIELVLHFNDAVLESDRNSAANIARKMSAGACMPMYMNPALDISQEIVNVLNAKYPVTTSAPAGGASH
jgi:Skp family chaperone for outer membrane proteins